MEAKETSSIRKRWKEIVYASILFSVFIIISIESFLLSINHIIDNDTFSLILNIAWVYGAIFIPMNPFSNNKKYARLTRKTLPFSIIIFIVSSLVLFWNYNLVMNKTITENDYANQSIIIVLVSIFVELLIYSLFSLQQWLRERKQRQTIESKQSISFSAKQENFSHHTRITRRVDKQTGICVKYKNNKGL